MSHKILLASAALAVLVIGFAWFTLSPQQPAAVVTNITPSASFTEPAVSTTTATSSSPTPAPASGYTLAQVKTHPNAASCWVAISGKVYDLTKWINQHPGGPDKILGICGTDATAAFNAQHSGQRQPAQELTNFYLGALQ